MASFVVGEDASIVWTLDSTVGFSAPNNPTQRFSAFSTAEREHQSVERVYRDFILRRTEPARVGYGIAVTPIVANEVRADQTHSLLSAKDVKSLLRWENSDYQLTGHDFFLRGRYLAFTAACRLPNHYEPHGSVVWNTEQKQALVTTRGSVLDLDDKYVYVVDSYFELGMAVITSIHRIALAAPHAEEKWELPGVEFAVLDFRPPSMIVQRVRHDFQPILWVDWEKKTAREFDFGTILGEKSAVVRRDITGRLSDPALINLPWSPHNGISGDATRGVVVVGTPDAVYRVPLKDGTVPFGEFRWEPVPAGSRESLRTTWAAATQPR